MVGRLALENELLKGASTASRAASAATPSVVTGPAVFRSPKEVLSALAPNLTARGGSRVRPTPPRERRARRSHGEDEAGDGGRRGRTGCGGCGCGGRRGVRRGSGRN